MPFYEHIHNEVIKNYDDGEERIEWFEKARRLMKTLKCGLCVQWNGCMKQNVESSMATTHRYVTITIIFYVNEVKFSFHMLLHVSYRPLSNWNKHEKAVERKGIRNAVW